MNLRQKFICFSRENKYLILMALAALLVAFLPLFTVNCVNGHDVEYHLLRIEALKTGILAGKPFLRVNMLYFGGRGYASSMFYPDFLLYIPALLRCAGVSINASYHIFIALCIVMSFAAMYYAAFLIGKKYAGKEQASLAGLAAGAIYVLAQYHIDDIYTRSAVGEYTAMIFIPLLMYGMLEVALGKIERPDLLIIGFAGTVLCHTTTTVFFVGIYVLCFVVSLVINLRKDKAGFVRMTAVLAACAAAVLIITAFYWLPMLEQFMSASFQTDAGGFDMNYEKLLVRDIFRNANPGLGAALPVLTLALGIWVHSDAVLQGEKREVLCCADAFSILAALFALGSTGILPWGRLQRFVGFIQFPWRLFIVASPMMAMACAVYIIVIMNRKSQEAEGRDIKVGRLVVLVITAVMMVSAMCNISRIDEGYYSYSNDYYDYVEHTGNVIGGEWLPVTVTDRNALKENCDIAVTSAGEKIPVVRSANALSLDVPAGTEYVDVPFVFYKGYKAVGDGAAALMLDGTGENGSVRVYPAGCSSVRVYYGATAVQAAACAISIIFILGIIVTVIVIRRRNR